MTKKDQIGYEPFAQRIEELEKENAILREGFLRIYGAVTRSYSELGKQARRQVERYAKIVERVKPEERVGYLATMGEEMIKDLTPAALEQPGYSTKTKTESRALAIVDHLKMTGKRAIKSTEARAILTALEGKPLDRKIVWRALYRAQQIIIGDVDFVGGIGRLVVRVSVSRPQRDGVPWGT